MPNKHTEAIKTFKYLDIITGLFVAVLLISNISANKILTIGPFSLDGGGLLFPLSYIFGDVLTEVYGYKRARRVIWIGFICAILMAVTLAIVTALPAASDWPFQEDWKNVLGGTWRIVLASVIAYLAGELSNSFTLAKMKLATKGRWLWSRTIGSTLVGEAIDTTVFMFIAFWGVLPLDLFIAVGVSGYFFKCSVEVIFTPITYLVTNWLKKQENEDYYDTKTNFNPFKLS